jgi:uncharacterized cofD-like protein
VTGNFNEAVETASEILRVNGVVIPATLDNVRLKMEWPEASTVIKGEREIDAKYFKYDPRRANLSLEPLAVANPMAIKAIEQADMIVVAPGDLYTSIGPLLVIEGISEALKNTKAICVYVSNLVTKHGQTEGFTVKDHADEIERFVGEPFLDYVIYNKQIPSKNLSRRYAKEKAYIVKVDQKILNKSHYRAIADDLLGKVMKVDKADHFKVTRSLIRHDGVAVAKSLFKIFNNR